MKTKKYRRGHKKKTLEPSFERRAFIIGGIQAAGLTILGGRLAWLQIAQGDRYSTLSDRNRINVKFIPSKRGDIVDKNGVPLALNNRSFRVMLTPERAGDVSQAVQKLSRFISVNPEQVEKALDRAKRSPSFLAVEIARDLEWEDVAKIEVNMPDLPGISVEEHEVRSYPLAESAAHVVGYTGFATAEDFKKYDLENVPDVRVGKIGIERVYDQALRGKTGVAHVEVNVTGREVRELRREDAVPGRRIALTLDAGFQRYVLEQLSVQKSGSAVVMNVQSGDVYALASYPGFDPNRFTHSLPQGLWTELLNDPALPLINKAISGLYPPASTFKMITCLAALEQGVTNERQSFYCPGHFTFGKDRFHCWKKEGHGYVDMREAIAKSCDVYFYELATDIGIGPIADMARRFGLGQELGLSLEEEKAGLVPDDDWKRGHFGLSWKPGETIVTSIGQGSLLATPLQLATMLARMVNGGYAVKPQIVKTGRLLRQAPKIAVQDDFLAIVKEGMDIVVNNHTGTAYRSRIENPDWAMGGKTGTAQVKRITMEQRRLGIRNEDMEWESRHHALFVGYAPLHKPVYVCSVVIEHGGGGSEAAAPIARKILFEAQRRGIA